MKRTDEQAREFLDNIAEMSDGSLVAFYWKLCKRKGADRDTDGEDFVADEILRRMQK